MRHDKEALMRAQPAVPTHRRRRGSVSLVVLLLLVVAVPGYAIAAKSKSKDLHYQVKGLSPDVNGDPTDPDGKVTLTVKRNAKGVPTKVVDLKLSNVDSSCRRTTFDENGHYVDQENTPGPEVTAELVGSLPLKGKKTQHANYTSQVWRFDSPPSPRRTIGGVEYDLHFYMDGKNPSEVSLLIMRSTDGCAVNVNETLKRKKN
jgi:hypothetical protein